MNVSPCQSVDECLFGLQKKNGRKFWIQISQKIQEKEKIGKNTHTFVHGFNWQGLNTMMRVPNFRVLSPKNGVDIGDILNQPVPPPIYIHLYIRVVCKTKGIVGKRTHEESQVCRKKGCKT